MALRSVARSRARRRALVAGTLAAGVAAGVGYRRMRAGVGSDADVSPTPVGSGSAEAGGAARGADRESLGWGAGLTRPDHQVVRTGDGAHLAVWDLDGHGADAPVVVLPHCWGCSHEIWLPVARRLREEHGPRVVLYDQRGHGASTRGTAPLAIDTLGHDLAAVLEATDARDAVLAGHSMGGMTVMSLATHRPAVLKERAKATVLVSTAATTLGDRRSARGTSVARAFISSGVVTRAMQARNGHVFVRGVFGVNPVRAHLDLTRDLFAGCHGRVRGDFLVSMTEMNLLEGIATIDLPTTVIVGSRDTLTLPKKAHEIVAAISGARLVTLEDRGHMLPLEDPDAVTHEILLAIKS